MAATNQETPGLAAEGFEITSTTSKEQNMNETTVREPIRPIYGPSDIRWDELAHWFEINRERLVDDDGAPTATIEELQPAERAQWHALRILGIDRASAFHVIEYPDFPSVSAPAWSTSAEDCGVDTVTEHPMRLFMRELDTPAHAAIVQEAAWDPERDEVTMKETMLSVWVDGDTRVLFTDPVRVLEVVRSLLDGADALREAQESA